MSKIAPKLRSTFPVLNNILDTYNTEPRTEYFNILVYTQNNKQAVYTRNAEGKLFKLI